MLDSVEHVMEVGEEQVVTHRVKKGQNVGQ